MTQPRQRRGRHPVGLWVGPALLVASLAVWLVADRLVVIGPLDRAQITAFVAAPLYLLAPGALGVAAAHADPGRARLAMLACPAALALIATAWLMAAATQVGCRPVVSPLQVLGPALAVGISAAIAFGLPALVARRLVATGAHGARSALARGAVLAVAGALIVVPVASLVVFPITSCGAPA